MLCAKQGPKAGSFFLYVLLNDFPVQLTAVCCDVPVNYDLNTHKYLSQIIKCPHVLQSHSIEMYQCTMNYDELC